MSRADQLLGLFRRFPFSAACVVVTLLSALAAALMLGVIFIGVYPAQLYKAADHATTRTNPRATIASACVPFRAFMGIRIGSRRIPRAPRCSPGSRTAAPRTQAP